jgi:hypothetical protein
MIKIMSLILFLLFVTTPVSAYSKKIVFCTLFSEVEAKTSLENFKKSMEYKRLSRLAKEHNFKILYRKSKKYFAIVAEPFVEKEVATEALALIHKNYKDAYAMHYTALNVVEKDIEKDIKKVLKEDSKEEIEIVDEIGLTGKPLELKEREKREVVEDNIVKSHKDELIDVWAVVRYVVIFFFLFVGFFYYFKFKRLYH